jgi:hypothetical protein
MVGRKPLGARLRHCRCRGAGRAVQRVPVEVPAHNMRAVRAGAHGEPSSRGAVRSADPHHPRQVRHEGCGGRTVKAEQLTLPQKRHGLWPRCCAKTKAAPEGTANARSPIVVQPALRRRAMTPSPARPKPNRAMLAGSGVCVGRPGVITESEHEMAAPACVWVQVSEMDAVWPR